MTKNNIGKINAEDIEIHECDECGRYSLMFKGLEELENLEQLKRLKQSIINNQIDAQKYHDLMNANSEVIKNNIDITKEHEIVSRLKADYIYYLKKAQQTNNLSGYESDILDFIKEIWNGKCWQDGNVRPCLKHDDYKNFNGIDEIARKELKSILDMEKKE